MTTELDIKEWFEENNYKSEIELAKRIQLQNQVYTIPFSKIREGNKEFEKILERVELKIGNPKTFSTFKANISYPLEVSKFVNNKIFKALSKIWQGEGGYINRYPDDKDSSHTPDREFYSTNVWKRYITNPNDLIMLNVNSDNEIDWHFINIADVEY
ncbi:MAG: hypothetical protein GWN01_09900, partial [Nitrosopumilaceae archaeon]|nr:hypothetical protein [Nitrosopumilaceae archaeon]NIU87572.1 hypothetical protein [Nitrosopumilaceae archaeon]NIX61820.1 hypothetical protein [Nitrosopumilaceae archaeon]